MPLSRSDRAAHRKLGARYFNEAWRFLEKARRSREEELLMLDLAHSSRYHWGLVGDARAKAIADWQVSRVYAAVREPRLSMRYARACLAICDQHGLKELACTAEEALARACASASDLRGGRRHLARARALLEAAKLDAEGRAVYGGQILETERLLRRVAARRPTA